MEGQGKKRIPLEQMDKREFNLLTDFPAEVLEIILLYGGSEMLKTFLILDKSSDKIQYLWSEIYKLRFGKHPYWLLEEANKRAEKATEENWDMYLHERWRWFKNIYAWTHEVVSNILRVDEMISYQLQVKTPDDETRYIQLMYGRERHKVWVQTQDEGKSEVLKFDKDPKKLEITFFANFYDEKNSFDHIKSILFNTETGRLEWEFNEMPELRWLDEDQMPKFVKRLKKQLAFKWNANENELSVFSYPHLSSMLMNHFYIRPANLYVPLIMDHENRIQKYKTYFSRENVSLDDFKLFTLSLFFQEEEDFSLVRKYQPIDNKFVDRQTVLENLIIPTIFDSDPLPFNFQYPLTSCCVCAKSLITLKCEKCLKAVYCSTECLDLDAKIGHNRLCK